MRQISIVQARSNRGVFACWVYKQGLRRGEEGGGEHGRREPSKRVQVHFPLRNFETWTSLFRWSFSDPCWT